MTSKPRHSNGFTLVELCIILAILAALAGIVMPSLAAARELARRAACAARLHNIGGSLLMHASENRFSLPPFSFRDSRDPALATSGHWGGLADGAEADFGVLPDSKRNLNLWALVAQGRLDSRELVCPAAPELMQAAANPLGEGRLFSTYCLRFPLSLDLFGKFPPGPEGDLLRDFRFLAGGQRRAIGRRAPTLPLVQTHMSYRILAEAAAGDGRYDVSDDVLVADTFWTGRPAPDGTQLGRCHDRFYNVLHGDGSVAGLDDRKGKIEQFTTAPDGSQYQGASAERVWQLFDGF